MKTLLMLCATAALAAAQAAPPACCPERPATEKQQLLWQGLEGRIKDVEKGLDGALAVALQDLTTGQQLLLHADEIMPTASTIKIAVLAELYRQSQEGKGASLGDAYALDPADIVPDSRILERLAPGTRLTNRDLAVFMTSVSDNSATNILIDHVGMENVNAMLARQGLHGTRLRRKMMDLKAARQGRENVATPRELVTLLAAIYQGKLLNQAMMDDFFKKFADEVAKPCPTS